MASSIQVVVGIRGTLEESLRSAEDGETEPPAEGWGLFLVVEVGSD